MPCPGADELERAIVSGQTDEHIRLHLHACEACRQFEVIIRENLSFMEGLASRLGGGALEAAHRAVFAPDLLPGHLISREIARGGQGIVYEGVQLDTKRRVAVKMIESASPEAQSRRRLEREAELAASLRHPNIVSIYQSVVLPDGRLALVMEFVDGMTLSEWSRGIDERALPSREEMREAVRMKLRAVSAICDAVHYAHVNGVIHRDLKPANILVAPCGTPRVVDFGIARRIDHLTRITREGGFAGTLAYASPEQVSGDSKTVDIRSDVYALGVILYETLAGKRPYVTDGSLSGAIANITATPPEPLRIVQPGDQPAGAELESIVRMALAKEPDERYQSAAALKSDIDNWLAGLTIQARQHSAVYVLRKLALRHRVAVAAAAGVLLLLTLFAIAMAWSSNRLGHQRSLLASALSSSMIERGRLASLNGENARAEALIWPELVKTGADPASEGLTFDSPPQVMQPVWALYELHARHPSIMQLRVAPGTAALRFERDGRAIRVARVDGSHELRALPDGALLESSSRVLDFPPEHARIDTARQRMLLSDSGTAYVIELNDGSERTIGLSDPLEWIIDMSPDGSRYLSVSPDGTTRLWRTDRNDEICILAENVKPLCWPRFSPVGLQALAGLDEYIHIWNAEDASPITERTIPSEMWSSAVRSEIRALQISPNGHMLAAAFLNMLAIYPLFHEETPPLVLPAHRGYIGSIEFSADSRVLISSDSGRNCTTWDPVRGERLLEFEHGQPLFSSPTISADGALGAIFDSRDVLRIFETRPNQWLTRLSGPQNTVHAARFSPDGSLIAGVSADGSVRIWRIADHSEIWRADPTGYPLESLSFAPDGRSLVVAGRGDDIVTIDVDDPSQHRVLARSSVRITWLGHSRDGRLIIAAGIDPTLRLYDAGSGELVRTLEGHSRRVVEAAFSRDGALMASVGTDGLCIVWDIAKLEERYRLPQIDAPVRAVTFSPDGSLFATGSDDWKIRLWSTRSGQLLSTITGARQDVFSLVFHPAGNVLFSCGRDSVVQVWDIRTGGELAVLNGHEDLVLSIAIAPDGRTLASTSADRTLGLWNLDYYRAHLRGNIGFWRPGVRELAP